MRRARRQNERGFALLLVFAMAAAVGVMLYLEMPRVAFEHQRNKEGLLAERGEEYIRAIQLFYKKTNKYPQKIEDLESTNNIRFLRRRYKDPMTGDEEWRLIHVDSAGQFVDSLVHKRTEEKKESGPSVLSSNIVGIGASAEYVPQAGEKTGAAAIKRASDRIIPGMGGANATPAGEQNAQEPGADGSQPRSEAIAGQPGANPQQGQQGQGPAPGQPGQIITPGQPGQAQGQAQQGAAGQGQAGTGQQQQQQQGGGFGFGGGFGSGGNATPPAAPGQNSNTGQRQGSGLPGSNQSSGGFGQSSFGGNAMGGGQGQQAGSNQAVQAIQGMLTNPNQSRMGGMSATAGGSASGGPVQGGIVGVASKKDMEGIRVYNERSNYKEWEFLFDRKKALEAAGLNANGQPGQPGQQGQQGTQGQGTGSNSSGSPFGSFGGSGSQQPKPAPGGFGSGGFGSGSSSSGSSGSSSGSGFGRGN